MMGRKMLLPVALTVALAAGQSPVPLFMWGSDHGAYGGNNVYMTNPIELRELSSVVLPADVLPEVVVAYVGDQLSADEVADHVRKGHLASLQQHLKSAGSSAIAPYTYRPVDTAAEALGAVAATLSQLTNRTQPGGAFHAAGPLSDAQVAQLSSHVPGWKPVDLATLSAEDPMWSNGAVDVLAIFFGDAAAADDTITAAEDLLLSKVDATKYTSLLTAALNSAPKPTRVVHMGSGGARHLLAAADVVDAAAVSYLYASSNFLAGGMFMIVFTMIILLGSCCMLAIQTPTQYWSDKDFTLGKLDE